MLYLESQYVLVLSSRQKHELIKYKHALFLVK